MKTKFWIVGGEYRDTDFLEIRQGTESLSGPFPSYADALSEWRRLATETRSNACARFTIACETAAATAAQA